MKSSRMRWARLLAALAAVNAHVALAQAQDTAAPVSTRVGVYTAAQAERGRITYAGMCRSCHSAASHSGATFEKWWKGKTVADLFGYASTQMPKNNPGSLNPDEYADVIAYQAERNAGWRARTGRRLGVTRDGTDRDATKVGKARRAEAACNATSKAREKPSQLDPTLVRTRQNSSELVRSSSPLVTKED